MSEVTEDINKILKVVDIWERCDRVTIHNLSYIPYEELDILLDLMVSKGDIIYKDGKYTLEKYL